MEHEREALQRRVRSASEQADVAAQAREVLAIALKASYQDAGLTQTQAPTFEHDFPSAARQGKLTPHGLYDLARNEGRAGI